jgi:hypothetical protein
MNREALEARIAELQKAVDQLHANGNALMGAIQECNHWLAQVDEPETPAVRDPIAGSTKAK